MRGPPEHYDARCRQESLDQARERLGDARLGEAYATGMALGFDRALDMAIG